MSPIRVSGLRHRLSSTTKRTHRTNRIERVTEQRNRADMSAILTAATTNEAFCAVADATNTDTEAPISYERCVNWLLDLHQSTTNPTLRSLIIDVLSDLGELGAVSSDSELESLILGSLASVEIAFEVAEGV